MREFKGGIHAVDGIDLEVAAGEIYGFLGPNGAGKSTTVHMLTTLLPPTAGRATVAGFDVATQGPDVRRHIGAALQEAALDNFLTGREHMDLQGGSRPGRRPTAPRRGDRAARARRPDRGGRPQGRRLLGRHEAPPRPRAGARAPPVDPLPRRADHRPGPAEPQRAVGRGRSGWPRDDGVTVFLTTQYLEEADVLADRVGIIDRGRIVAEGTPDELKREIGGDTVEAIPADPHDLERAAEVLARFGQRAAHSPKGVAVRLSRGAEQLAEIVRALDDAGIALAHLQLHSPSLDDVFLAKTGRSLEGAGEEGEAAAEERRAGVTAVAGPGRPRRAALGAAHAAPARADRPDDRLPAVPARGQLERAERGDQHPRLPGRLLPGLRDHRLFIQGAMFAAITAGTELATDIETGFLNRLQLTPLRRPRRSSSARWRARRRWRSSASVTYLAVGLIAGRRHQERRRRRGARSSISRCFIARRVLGHRRALGARTGSAEAVQGVFPLMFVVLLPVVDEPAAQPDRESTGSARSRRGTRSPTWSRACAAWSSPAGTAPRCGAASAVGVGVLVLSFWAARAPCATRMERT